MEDFEASCCMSEIDTIWAIRSSTEVRVDVAEGGHPTSTVYLNDEDAERLCKWLRKALGKTGGEK